MTASILVDRMGADLLPGACVIYTAVLWQPILFYGVCCSPPGLRSLDWCFHPTHLSPLQIPLQWHWMWCLEAFLDIFGNLGVTTFQDTPSAFRQYLKALSMLMINLPAFTHYLSNKKIVHRSSILGFSGYDNNHYCLSLFQVNYSWPFLQLPQEWFWACQYLLGPCPWDLPLLEQACFWWHPDLVYEAGTTCQPEEGEMPILPHFGNCFYFYIALATMFPPK